MEYILIKTKRDSHYIRKLEIWSSRRNLLNNKPVDENCQLKIKFENNKESFFSSIGEILDLTDQENNPSVLEHEARGTNIGENV